MTTCEEAIKLVHDKINEGKLTEAKEIAKEVEQVLGFTPDIGEDYLVTKCGILFDKGYDYYMDEHLYMQGLYPETWYSTPYFSTFDGQRRAKLSTGNFLIMLKFVDEFWTQYSINTTLDECKEDLPPISEKKSFWRRLVK